MSETIPEARVVLPGVFARFFSAIFTSKKAIAAIATVVFTFLAPKLAALGITVTEVELDRVIEIVIGYLVGQGIADHGKEAAKIKAASGGDGPTAVATTGAVVVTTSATELPLAAPNVDP